MAVKDAGGSMTLFLFEWYDTEKSGGQKMFLKLDMLMAVLCFILHILAF